MEWGDARCIGPRGGCVRVARSLPIHAAPAVSGRLNSRLSLHGGHTLWRNLSRPTESSLPRRNPPAGAVDGLAPALFGGQPLSRICPPGCSAGLMLEQDGLRRHPSNPLH